MIFASGINIFILIMIIKSQDYKIFMLLMILGGSFGNLFDRLYYKAVPDFIDAMFAGKKINSTEGRPVLHTALRGD